VMDDRAPGRCLEEETLAALSRLQMDG
jgi:hypothetical protein